MKARHRTDCSPASAHALATGNRACCDDEKEERAPADTWAGRGKARAAPVGEDHWCESGKAGSRCERETTMSGRMRDGAFWNPGARDAKGVYLLRRAALLIARSAYRLHVERARVIAMVIVSGLRPAIDACQCVGCWKIACLYRLLHRPMGLRCATRTVRFVSATTKAICGQDMPLSERRLTDEAVLHHTAAWAGNRSA